jgi:hypothetical protein
MGVLAMAEGKAGKRDWSGSRLWRIAGENRCSSRVKSCRCGVCT